MFRFKYRYCKVLMARYVSGDLPLAARRRVARYIDECEDCYREYMRHREFTQELERNLPTLGRPASAQLNQVWERLQDDLQAPAQERAWLRGYGASGSLHFSYSLVLAAIALALLVPLMLGYQAAMFTGDLPRVPQYAAIVSTPSTALAASPLNISTAAIGGEPLSPMLHNTPAPRL